MVFLWFAHSKNRSNRKNPQRQFREIGRKSRCNPQTNTKLHVALQCVMPDGPNRLAVLRATSAYMTSGKLYRLAVLKPQGIHLISSSYLPIGTYCHQGCPKRTHIVPQGYSALNPHPHPTPHPPAPIPTNPHPHQPPTPTNPIPTNPHTTPIPARLGGREGVSTPIAYRLIFT